MRRTLAKWLVAGALAGFGLLGFAAAAEAAAPAGSPVTLADITDSDGTNVQEGDNEGTSTQAGTSGSGDSVAGQVAGFVVGEGASATADATNRSEDVDARSGDAEATNIQSTFVGLAAADDIEVETDDITDTDADNLQEGDNEFSSVQTAEAFTGDAVGGQVIGVVVSAGGSADITADNSTEDADIDTGEAFSLNEAASFVGLALGEEEVEVDDFADTTTRSQTPDAGASLGATPAPLGSTLASGNGTGTASTGGDALTGADSDGDGGTPGPQTSGLVSSEQGNLDTASRAGGDDPAIEDIDDVDVGDGNVQEGNNEMSLTQQIESTSGDGVAGQVIGVVSAGATVIDATNSTVDADVDTGEVDGANDAASFTGLANSENDGVDIEDITDAEVNDGNLQEGDNDLSLTQTASLASGDGVAGSVIGVVTAAGGSADITADNSSEDIDIDTGDIDTFNQANQFVGLAYADEDVEIEVDDIDDVLIDEGNVQEGDNEADITQAIDATTGDGVGGQVIGVVSAGATVMDATNSSEDVDIDTGDSDAFNEALSFTGLAYADEDEIDVGDITDVDVRDDANVQEGDNDLSLSQSATLATGDGVGGQVIGVVTAAGGSADITADNSSEDIDVDTGDAFTDNEANTFVGLAFGDDGVEIGDIDDVDSESDLNLQEGDNTADITQTTDAATGDGVGGQVIGVVSAGATVMDATNSSEDIDVDTGDADAFNEANSFVGLAQTEDGDIEIDDITDIDAGDEANIQEGDNDLSLAQAASSASGDGVGGQVIGVVTAAGGSADITADNSSEDVDVETGDAFTDNEANTFVGLALSDEDDVEIGDIDDIDIDEDGNIQEGDNEAAITQTSDAATGDGVGGQVIGVVSAGATVMDATNSSEDIDVDTGDADASNEANSFVGLVYADEDVEIDDISDVDDVSEANVQEGDNDLSLAQAASSASGDGVGGQVIGVVTSAGGSADITADNSSEDIDVDTGDAFTDNEANTFVGLALSNEDDVEVGDIDDIDIDDDGNIQEGDNTADITQTTDAATGDGVGGQVIGVVSAGATVMDATNSSEDVDAETGDADAENDADSFVGLATADDGDVDIGDITDANIDETGNIQEGDNDLSLSQAASSASGDGVGGQVIGVVTSAGGSADITADNSSEDIDVETGDAFSDNEANTFVGLAAVEDEVDIGDIDEADVDDGNIQEGDNEAAITQTADAATGDGVGGQVIGVVSAGATVMDATNSSEDVDVDTGQADATNDAESFVGLATSDDGDIDIGDIIDSEVGDEGNLQEGDNDLSLSQAASSATGDGVGGQVIGVVTSAGGSADITADNSSEDIDAETGDADADNNAEQFVGLAQTDDGDIEVDDIIDSDADDGNVQEGDNELSGSQIADANSGDAVGGQVLGIVSSGDVTLDATNASEDIDARSGNAEADNDAATFVGLAVADDGDVEVGDIDGVDDAENIQEGDNEFSFGQTADANSGDAVGGQVAGIVAAGTADITLNNEAIDADTRTGESFFDNVGNVFVGLASADEDVDVEDLLGTFLRAF